MSEQSTDDPITTKLKADVQAWVNIRDEARVDHRPEDQRSAIRMIHITEQALYLQSKGHLK